MKQNALGLVFLLAFGGPVGRAETKTYPLKAGDKITIRGEDAVVTCEAPPDADTKPSGARNHCHKFYGNESCHGLAVGMPCKKGKSIGTCVSNEIFDGAPNCDCI